MKPADFSGAGSAEEAACAVTVLACLRAGSVGMLRSGFCGSIGAVWARGQTRPEAATPPTGETNGREVCHSSKPPRMHSRAAYTHELGQRSVALAAQLALP